MRSLYSLLIFSVLGFAQEDISIQAITDNSCGGEGGTVITNVHANPANEFATSNCIAPGQFQSVNVPFAGTGFLCNIYADPRCEQEILRIGIEICQPIIGQGIICLDQDAADAGAVQDKLDDIRIGLPGAPASDNNPFSGATAAITIGTTYVPVLGSGLDQVAGPLVLQATNIGCTDTGCNPTNPATQFWEISGGDCNVAVSVTGNYEGFNQRDYLSGLLQTSVSNSMGKVDNGDGPNPRTTRQMVSFIQVVINDNENGANLAEMTVTTQTTCQQVRNPPGVDCNGILGTLTGATLGAVPAFGGVLAGAFKITCAF